MATRLSRYIHSFNPRARAGRDARLMYGILSASVSIHAPVRGATYVCGMEELGYGVSIHAPVRGATLPLEGQSAEEPFQSTRPCGARPV